MDNPYVEYSFSRVVLFDFFHTTQVIYLKKICLYLSFSCYFIFYVSKEIKRPSNIIKSSSRRSKEKILKSRGFSELELLANWERIVGKKFAKLTIPLRLKIGKSSEKNNGKLIVKVDRSVAFAFEHEREKIIKKINLFGYEVINKVEIIQASIKVKKTIKINELESDIKSQSKNYDELKKYPDLRRNFEKIASKILKS